MTRIFTVLVLIGCLAACSSHIASKPLEDDSKVELAIINSRIDVLSRQQVELMRTFLDLQNSAVGFAHDTNASIKAINASISSLDRLVVPMQIQGGVIDCLGFTTLFPTAGNIRPCVTNAVRP